MFINRRRSKFIRLSVCVRNFYALQTETIISVGCILVIMTTFLLEEEIKTYQTEKARLVSEHNGKYVLIKGIAIVGIFESEKDALKIGIEKFGNTPFLVKKIESVEPNENYTSNLIKVISHAVSHH